MNAELLPLKWGTSAARFYARCEGEELAAHLITGEVLMGVLLGVDKYDIVLERDSVTILVAKHAIAWLEPGPQETISRRLENIEATTASRSEDKKATDD